MNIVKKISTIIFVVLLSSCVETVEQNEVFDPEMAKYINETGSGSISGQAFLTQSGGGVVFAAGQLVRLLPVTAYTNERMTILYGSSKISRGLVQTTPIDPNFVRNFVKSTKADGNGRFKFNGLVDGSYFVTTTVTWVVGDVRQGGAIRELVTIKDGASIELIMNGL